MNAVIQALEAMVWMFGDALVLGLAIGLPVLIIQNTIQLSKLRRRLAALELELKRQAAEPGFVERSAPGMATRGSPEPSTRRGFQGDPAPTSGTPQPTTAPAQSAPAQSASAESTPTKSTPAQSEPAISSPAQSKPQAKPSTGRWRQLETQLLKNWTGVLGVAAIVAGVAFVAISAISVMAPVLRFLVVEGICLAMVIPSLLVKSDSSFRSLTLWLRSGAGALHLFATAAAITWPGLGLQWVDSAGLALALLGSAIGINLLLAQIAPSAWLSATHVLISLVPITAAAPSTETQALVGLITLIGLISPAGRQGPTRTLITTSCLVALLWMNIDPATAIGDGPRQSDIAAVIGCVVAGFDLWRLHWHPPNRVQRSQSWLRASSAIAWITVLVLLQAPHWGAAGLFAAALCAGGFSRLKRLPVAKALALTDWSAALVLAVTAIGRLLQPLDQPLMLAMVLILLSAGFLIDALQRRDGWMTRLAGAALLLFDTVVLVLLVDGHGAAADFIVLSGIGLGQQWLIRRSAEASGLAWIRTGLALAGVGLPALAIWTMNDLALSGSRDWLKVGFLLISLALARWPKPMQQHRQIVLIGAVLVWINICITVLLSVGVNSTLWSLAHFGGTIPPMLLLSAGVCIATDRLNGTLCRGRSVGLVLSTATLALGGWGLQAALSLPKLGFAPLAWLMLMGMLLVMADRGLKRGLQGEADVLLSLAWISLLSFGLNRLATTSTDLSPVVLALVDGSGILTLMLLRLWRTNSPLKERPLWKAIHRVSGDLAVFGLILCILSRGPTALLAPSAAGLTLILWRLPVDAIWPRQRVQGVLLFWLSLVLLVATPATGWPLQTANLTLLVIAACSYPRTPQTHAQPSPAVLGWMSAIDALVCRQPQRFLAAPLSMAVVLVVLQGGADGTWLTLIWAVEALVLYSLSILCRDRPLRLSALMLLGFCLLRLVGWDMRRAELGLRGLVFSGVGLVMVAMNVLTTRFERGTSEPSPPHKISDR